MRSLCQQKFPFSLKKRLLAHGLIRIYWNNKFIILVAYDLTNIIWCSIKPHVPCWLTLNHEVPLPQTLFQVLEIHWGLLPIVPVFLLIFYYFLEKIVIFCWKKCFFRSGYVHSKWVWSHNFWAKTNPNSVLKF